jgi:glycosyltransferase involved in cell wall biosynthesis
MDRHVPPRVTYWTGIWEPAREAISREVDLLRRMNGEAAPVVSFSPGQRSALRRRQGVIRLSGKRWIALRALAALTEKAGDVTHVVGPMNAWHLLRAVGRRPIVFTVVVPGPVLGPELFGKVRIFVAETEPLAASLRGAGVPADRVRVIYPGVDLDRFTPAPPPPGRFRVVFASSPANADDFARRGIPLLVEAARACPEVDVVLLWRQWGDRTAADRALAALHPPANLIVEHKDVADMSAAFQAAHATIWMAEAGHGKACPNSVVEGLACGRPAIVSPTCGIAGVIRDSGAGLAPDPEPAAVAAALRALTREPDQWRARARSLAEQHFSLASFSSAYQALYREAASASRH